MLKGIDVSSYNGTIDWQAVKKEGWSFAILKVIRKDLLSDKQFENNWEGCLNVGLPIQGVYNYTYATTVKKAQSDAKAVLKVLGKDRHPMVWLDYEDATLPKTALAADIINAYGDVITAGGCKFGVYFGKSYYETYLSKIWNKIKTEYRTGWEARYYKGYTAMQYNSCVDLTKKPSGFNGSLLGWQYTSAGRVSGINGKVDLNIWFTDVEASQAYVEEKKYDIADFINDSRKIWKVSSTASAQEILNKTVTISTVQNRYHSLVTPLERYLKTLGYYVGEIEADNKKVPIYGNGLAKAVMLYQAHNVKAAKKYQDGILTAKGATYKKLYGIV